MEQAQKKQAWPRDGLEHLGRQQSYVCIFANTVQY